MKLKNGSKSGPKKGKNASNRRVEKGRTQKVNKNGSKAKFNKKSTQNRQTELIKRLDKKTDHVDIRRPEKEFQKMEMQTPPPTQDIDDAILALTNL